MKKCTLLLILGLYSLSLCAQAPNSGKKQMEALRTEAPIALDGLLNDPAWTQAAPATDFIQFEPVPGAAPAFPTSVKVVYDNTGLYISAHMKDSRPDSILQELSQRDRLGNTDWFGVFIDAYKDGINGLMFIVTAGGVQFDAKVTSMQNNENGWEIVRGEDTNWDAVWESQTRITEDGWAVEMKIPYAAIRFPKAPEQNWNINFARLIRRHQERSYWNSVDPQQNGFFNQAGAISGISNIKAPLRLQAFPFIAVYGENYHDKHSSPKNSFGRSFNGGMDVKFGINDAFTLDMTLIPDFGQAQSDNQVLNLSPFEVRFDENRQFFTEGTELFNKGGLFYSRRIGGNPLHYEDIYNNLAEGEEVIKNPQQSQLYNATKISGRTNKGLGIGFFNATSGRSHAIIRDAEGLEREVQTDPLTNFNVLVLDQNLPNNSYVSLINTTVLRSGSDYDANVSGAVFSLRNKANSYALNGHSALSQKYFPGQTDLGHTYSLGLSKTSGALSWGANYSMESDTYDPNDLGFLFNNNSREWNIYTEYNVFKPFWKIFNAGGFGGYGFYGRLYNPAKYTDFGLNFYGWVQTKKFWNFNVWTYHEPFITYDYFEARKAGQGYRYPTNNNYGFNINTDSRKALQVSMNTNLRRWSENDRHNWNWTISPRYRVNDKLNFRFSVGMYNAFDNMGFATNRIVNVLDPNTGEPVEKEEIIFGRRDNITVENTFSTAYTFNSKMALNFRLRHYWSKVEYFQFHLLNSDGTLAPTDYVGNHDRNYNAFNIDMVYRWRFAPGSDLYVVWKNSIFEFAEMASPNYFDNLDRMLEAPQQNSISVKLIYFIDYARLVGKG